MELKNIHRNNNQNFPFMQNLKLQTLKEIYANTHHFFVVVVLGSGHHSRSEVIAQHGFDLHLLAG